MKHNAILRIILFSITIVVLLAILAGGLTLRRWEWRLNPLAASPEESMAAVPAEEGTASRDSAVTVSSSQVREMEINWAAGSILIQPADVQEITISESAVSDAANAMRWRHSGSKLLCQRQGTLDVLRMPRQTDNARKNAPDSGSTAQPYDSVPFRLL